MNYIVAAMIVDDLEYALLTGDEDPIEYGFIVPPAGQQQIREVV